MIKEPGRPTPPPGEIVWVSRYDKNHDLRYIITSKPARDSYSLYELVDGKFVHWGRGQDPQSLQNRYEKASHTPEPEPEEDWELEP